MPDDHAQRPEVAGVSANAKPDAGGRVSVSVSDWTLEAKSASCQPWIETVHHCKGGVAVSVKGPGGIAQVLQVDELYLNTEATAYRGPLGDGYQEHGYSFILGDINGDGRDDLMIATGREGGYGGRSYDVYLFDAATNAFAHNAALTQQMEGANAPFTVRADGRLALSFTDGCCLHVFETYELQNGRAVLVERVSEDSHEPGKPSSKTERLINGQLQEVPAP